MFLWWTHSTQYLCQKRWPKVAHLVSALGYSLISHQRRQGSESQSSWGIVNVCRDAQPFVGRGDDETTRQIVVSSALPLERSILRPHGVELSSWREKVDNHSIAQNSGTTKQPTIA